MRPRRAPPGPKAASGTGRQERSGNSRQHVPGIKAKIKLTLARCEVETHCDIWGDNTI